MEQQLTAEDGRQSMEAHVANKGLALQDKYGPCIGWNELIRILEDRSFVRYPCTIRFDAEPLLEGEFACVVPTGEAPEDGFTVAVHPWFSTQRARVPALVLYHLVAVNYGTFASPDDAEVFGACALNLSKDDYYQMLCDAADEVDPCGAGRC